MANLKIGDEVTVDGQKCKVIKFGKHGAVIVKPINPPTKGRRLAMAVLYSDGLKKP